MSRLSSKLEIVGDFERIVSLFRKKNAARLRIEKSGSSGWEWNAAQDTVYAHQVERMADVLQVFHQEWHGIRAACGSLPGLKLALTERSIAKQDIDLLVDEILQSNASRIVFHGFSENTSKVIDSLWQQGSDVPRYVVFHGSPAQWWSEPERKLAFSAIDCAKESRISRLHIMKSGMLLPDVELFQPMLFNLSPMHGLNTQHFASPPRAGAGANVFIPGWGNWIKNVFGSAYGASLSKSVEEIWVYAAGLELPGELNSKVRFLPPGDRLETFKRYRLCDITMNVSLIDCHPMVNVESQSFGTPCIRSELNLDAFEDHQYVKIVTVPHNNSPSDIRDTVDRVLSIDPQEMKEMALDYQRSIDRISLNRYCDFLSL